MSNTESTIKKRKWDEPTEQSTSTSSSTSKIIKLDEEDTKPSSVALDAAALVASKIAAQYSNSKPVIEKDVPYVSGAREAGDPEFVKDIEINDIRNRYLLTKGPTQQQISTETGASVTTKGVWYPDKSMSTDKDPPLYLHITAETQAKLDAGVLACQELIDQELGPLIDQSRFRDRDVPRERKKWPEEKLFIELDSMRNFNVRAKVVGPGGLFVKYIQQETQTRVQVKGIGSGFIETDTGLEGLDAMHVHVTGPDQVMVNKATEFAQDLLLVVREEYQKAKLINEQPPPPPPQAQQGGMAGQQGGYGAMGGAGGYAGYGQGGYGGYQQPFTPGLTAPLPSGEAPPLPPSFQPPPPPPLSSIYPLDEPIPCPPQAAGSTATEEEWKAYWEGLDRGGREYYMLYYAQSYIPPPPPPPSPYPAQPSQPLPPPPPAPPSAVPPPPPPPGNGGGGKGVYGNVAPPAGL